MDLNSAEKSVKKLLIYLQSVSDSDSKLYDKSKQKLRGISDMCIQVISVVSDILETEILEDETQEFESKPNAEIQAKLDKMDRELSRLKTFAQLNDSNKITSTSVIVNPENKMTPSEMSEVVLNYKNILNKLANTEFKIPILNDCFSVIWKWFEARLLTKYDNAPPFHYNVYRIKNILYAIVIFLGYSIEHNEYDSFFTMFEDWLYNLSLSENSNKWIAPYHIYQIERNMTAEYANLTAVVIWDMLLDSGLSELCKIDCKYDVYIKKNEIWDRIQNINPDVLDKYVYYKDDISILKSLHIIERS